MMRYNSARALFKMKIDAAGDFRPQIADFGFSPWKIQQIVVREGHFFWKRERAVPTTCFRLVSSKHIQLALTRMELHRLPIVFRSRMPVESWNEVVIAMNQDCNEAKGNASSASEEPRPETPSKFWLSRIFGEPFVYQTRRLGEVEDVIIQLDTLEMVDLLVRLSDDTQKLFPIRTTDYDGFQFQSRFPYWIVEKAPSLGAIPNYQEAHEQTSRFLKHYSEIDASPSATELHQRVTALR